MIFHVAYVELAQVQFRDRGILPWGRIAPLDARPMKTADLRLHQGSLRMQAQTQQGICMIFLALGGQSIRVLIQVSECSLMCGYSFSVKCTPEYNNTGSQ